jgi:hypothetical protein
VARSAPTVDPDLAAARALFHAAEGDEQAGRWAEALVKLRRASTVKMTPGLRFHIALCEERTGQLVAALDDFTAAQTAARAEDNRDVLALVSDPLLAIKLRVPTLTVVMPETLGTRPDVEVRLDGKVLPAAALGAPVPVDVGSHTVQAIAPGKVPYAVTVTLVERQAETIHAQFVALPTPPEAPQVRVVPAPEPTPAHPSRVPAIVATAGAAVLLGAGIGAYAAAGSDESYWKGICSHEPAPCGNATPVRAWDATALGAWIAATGAAIGAVVLWAQPSATAHAHAAGELRVGPDAVWLTGSF